MGDRQEPVIESIPALEAAYPELVSQIRAQAETAGREAGVEGERQRASRILTNAKEGQHTLAAELVASGTETIDAFEKLLADPRKDAAATAATRASAAPEPVEPIPQSTQASSDGAFTPANAIEEAAVTAFNADQDLRAEFGSAKAYCMYLRNANRQVAAGASR